MIRSLRRLRHPARRTCLPSREERPQVEAEERDVPYLGNGWMLEVDFTQILAHYGWDYTWGCLKGGSPASFDNLIGDP